MTELIPYIYLGLFVGATHFLCLTIEIRRGVSGLIHQQNHYQTMSYWRLYKTSKTYRNWFDEKTYDDWR